jgi:hypothetical protein
MAITSYSATERLTVGRINTYALNNSMKFVASQTSSANVNGFEMYNVFTSEFDAYRIVLSQLFTYNTAAVNLTMQMATGGTTPYTGAAYYSASLGINFSGSAVTANGNGTTSWFLTSLYQNGVRSSSGIIEINVPQSSSKPTYESMFVDVGAAGLASGKNWMGGGFVNNAATYTGFKIYSPTYSINGTCVVYGYRKA